MPCLEVTLAALKETLDDAPDCSERHRSNSLHGKRLCLQDDAGDADDAPSPPSSARDSRTGDSWRLVTTAEELATVARAVEETSLVGIDLETTGLDPRTDRVRLISQACDSSDGGQFLYLVDCFAVDPQPLFEPLAGVSLLNHNIGFDLGFLYRMGFEPGGRVFDLMLLSQLL